MTTVHFTTLYCQRKQDVVGKDEPEIWIDGRKEWKGVIAKKESLPLGGLHADFSDSVKVELKERNPNSVKSLGVVKINGGSASPATFKTPGAHYELSFAIS